MLNRPSASTWTSSPCATSATRPGMRSSPTCGSAAARSCSGSATALKVDRGHADLVVAVPRHGRHLGLDPLQVLVGELQVGRPRVLLEILPPLGAGDRHDVVAL